MFSDASTQSSLSIRECLLQFQKPSSQMVNFEKLEIVFFNHTHESIVAQISHSMSIQPNQYPEKYLGVLSILGRKKVELFSFVNGKVEERLTRWKDQMLSTTGKEVLMKSVISTIPSYAISSFLLPKSVCGKIDWKQRAFWWGSMKSREENSLGVMGYYKKPKKVGEIGI